MRSGFRKKLDDLNLELESKYRKYSYRKKAKIRLKKMNGGYNCDKEYESIVVPYWKRFGYKPQKFWYEIFSDREQKVDPRYIPDDLYYGELVPYFSNSQFRRFGEDKCYHDLWFSEIKRPKTLVKNVAGVFYDENYRVLTKEEALDILMASDEEFLIKPSIDSGEGRLISFFKKEDMTREKFTKTIDELGANYIAQHVVKQHPTLAKLNPSSLNTIRIVTFFFENEVHVLSSILRIGAKNSRVDNVGAGGFACPINPDGSLKEKAVNRKAEWVTENYDGIPFKGIVIENYEKVVEAVKDNHKKLAHFKLAGWDMSVNEEGEPIFIECNTCPGSNQITCGPTFGDLTERVLQEYFIDKTLKHAQN